MLALAASQGADGLEVDESSARQQVITISAWRHPAEQRRAACSADCACLKCATLLVGCAALDFQQAKLLLLASLQLSSGAAKLVAWRGSKQAAAALAAF